MVARHFVLWSKVRHRFLVAVLISLALHVFARPWSIFPSESTLEIVDVDAGLSLSLDLMAGADDPAPPSPPPAPVEVPHGGGPRASDAGAPKPVHKPLDNPDAGIDRTATKATEMVGAAGQVQPGVPLVVLLINMAEIRKNSIGRAIGPLLTAIPQWNEFMSGTNVDPVRDTNWFMIQGPSLADTARDAILIQYSAPDSVVDHAIKLIGQKYDSGGKFHLGVRGVHAMLAHADRAPRVFLRPQPHLVAIVPPDYAVTAAKILSRARVNPNVRQGEALRLSLQKPYLALSFLPKTIKSLLLWIEPRDNDAGELFVDFDCTDARAAAETAAAIRETVNSQNTFAVRVLSLRLLDRVRVSAQGTHAHVSLRASHDQLSALFAFASGKLGVTTTSVGSRNAKE